ncbi:MAG: HNH endonuclease [Treponema sp.]|nr:HNH endonuclease [Treponema sp.]
MQYYGTKCVVCGFDFEKTYSELGKGFIHVHHLKEISSIDKEYELDPIKDLRPLCPNCTQWFIAERTLYHQNNYKKLSKNGNNNIY